MSHARANAKSALGRGNAPYTPLRRPQQASSQPMERLATRSLLLEPLTSAEYPWVVDLYGDAEVMRYIGNGPRTESETRQRLDWLFDQARRLGFGYWVLRDRATREPLGGAMLMVRSPGSTVEGGFALARGGRGRGPPGDAVSPPRRRRRSSITPSTASAPPRWRPSRTRKTPRRAPSCARS